MPTNEAATKPARNVLVTGGNRGIGLALAKAFADAGDNVVDVLLASVTLHNDDHILCLLH